MLERLARLFWPRWLSRVACLPRLEPLNDPPALLRDFCFCPADLFFDDRVLERLSRLFWPRWLSRVAR